MSAIATYTLDEFVHDLQESFASNDNLVGRADAVAAVLQRLLKVGGWVQEMIDRDGYDSLPGAVYTDEKYGHPGPGFHITCSTQRPGQQSTPHDHGAGWVVYGTFEGAIQQTRWGWDYSDGALTPTLMKHMSFVQKPGDTAYFLPGEIHDTLNVAERSVVVRVESQKMSTIWRHRYFPEKNSAKPFMG